MISSRLTLVVLAAVGMLGCKGASKEAYVATGPLARVLIDSTGTILLNAQPISASVLADSLKALQVAGGAVLYSRRPYSPEPTPSQAGVMRDVLAAIVSAKLPVRLLHPDSLSLPDSLLRK
jgi:hypothetical protein